MISSYPKRYEQAQRNRTLIHPRLTQPDEISDCDVNDDDTASTALSSDSSTATSTATTTTQPEGHSFVVCADTQLGMLSGCLEWETELEYSRQAIAMINQMEPRPAFCCMCGDLVDMEHTFFTGKGFTKGECDAIQDKQNEDFKQTWSALHEDIAMVCLCGNHDVGNRPNKASIDKFTNAFGDDYLAFWANGTYNIVLNSNIISNPSAAEDLYKEQLEWLKGRLQYAQAHNARMIFVFQHHPWFLYQEDEDEDEMTGASIVTDWGPTTRQFPDGYFVIPKKYRQVYMALFQQYNVKASFSGHFHQNHTAKTSFGMEMIITGPLSMIFNSTGKSDTTTSTQEPPSRGIRLVEVDGTESSFTHRFVSLEEGPATVNTKQ